MTKIGTQLPGTFFPRTTPWAGNQGSSWGGGVCEENGGGYCPPNGNGGPYQPDTVCWAKYFAIVSTELIEAADIIIIRWTTSLQCICKDSWQPPPVASASIIPGHNERPPPSTEENRVEQIWRKSKVILSCHGCKKGEIEGEVYPDGPGDGGVEIGCPCRCMEPAFESCPQVAPGPQEGGCTMPGTFIQQIDAAGNPIRLGHDTIGYMWGQRFRRTISRLLDKKILLAQRCLLCHGYE